MAAVLSRFSLLTSVVILSAAIPAYADAALKKQPLRIQFEAPTYAIHLYNQKTNDEQSFSDAVLFYYSNGLYKIVSPRIELYGAYVLQGHFSDPEYTVHYISLPRANRYQRPTYHQLTFDNKQSIFRQAGPPQIEQVLSVLKGKFKIMANPYIDPAKATWDDTLIDRLENMQ